MWSNYIKRSPNLNTENFCAKCQDSISLKWHGMDTLPEDGIQKEGFAKTCNGPLDASKAECILTTK